jgi:hypothetical protein
MSRSNNHQKTARPAVKPHRGKKRETAFRPGSAAAQGAGGIAACPARTAGNEKMAFLELVDSI